MPYNSFNQLVESQADAPKVSQFSVFNPAPTENIDVTSQTDGTVTTGAIQQTQKATNPPPNTHPTVQSLNHRVTALEQDVKTIKTDVSEINKKLDTLVGNRQQ